MSVITPQLQRSWTQVSALLNIQNERDYDLALERLNGLIDEVGTDEGHPLYSYRFCNFMRPMTEALVQVKWPQRACPMFCPLTDCRLGPLFLFDRHRTLFFTYEETSVERNHESDR